MRNYLVCFTTILLLVSCDQAQRNDHTSRVHIDGSSTVYPITKLVKSKYEKQKEETDRQINLQVSGTGGGFQTLCEGDVQIANASREISDNERQHCNRNGISFFKIPIALDGIAIVVHPENTWVDYLSVQELQRLWSPNAERSITKWSDVRGSWPDRRIRIYGPGSASGTYDYFTKSILPQKGTTRGDYVATEDDNFLVSGVANDTNSLGLFGLGYYQENFYKLRLVPIKSERNAPVMPSLETVKNGTYQPLSRSLYMYVARKAVKRRPVRNFIKFFMNHAPEIVREIGYVPQPAARYSRVIERLDTVTVSRQGK